MLATPPMKPRLRRFLEDGPLRRRALLCLGVAGLVMAWVLYPPENRYSPMRCTISYLGSPDADRNPGGWRIYQVGMTALLLWMADLLALRHRRGVARWASLGGIATLTLALGLAMILVTVWIPDSRSGRLFGMTSGQFHTRIALCGIPILGLGVVLDAAAHLRAGGGLRSLWPFHLYAGVSAFGFHQLMEWERLCREDRSLRHWPGDGLHSTPLWEWIFFVGLMLHWSWMARHREPRSGASG
jgi:hypothetical protein